MKKSEILSEENVVSALIKLSLPATIGMVVNALYNIIDTIFVGQFVGDMGIAGLGVSFPLQMLALGISGMFGMGAASIASRQMGAGDMKNADRTVSTMLFYDIVVIVLLSSLSLIFIEPILKLFGATDNIYPFAFDYLKIIIPGFIAFSFGVAMNNIVRAEGNAKIAMISMLIGAVGNILLDYVFMGIFKFGIEGAAVATVISQSLSALFLISYMVSGKSHFKLSLKKVEYKLKLITDIIKIGIPSLLTQAGTSILVIIINKSLVFYGGVYGEISIAIYSVINKILSFMIMPEIGIRQGTQPLLGYAYGNKNYNRVNDIIKASLKTLFIYSIISYLTIMIFARPIISLFGIDSQLLGMATNSLRIVIALIFVVPLQVLSSCLFQSIGRAIPALITSMLRQLICLIPLVVIIPYFTGWGITGIWIAFPIADLISSIISGVMMKKELGKICHEDFVDVNVN